MENSEYVVIAGRDPWAERNARARFREKVAEQARRGEQPEALFSWPDLEAAFIEEGFEDELEELRQLAADVSERKRAQEARVQAADLLWRTTDAVLAEWDAAEAAERRKRAEVEARKRLGLDETA